jgi:hypothetical protein
LLEHRFPAPIDDDPDEEYLDNDEELEVLRTEVVTEKTSDLDSDDSDEDGMPLRDAPAHEPPYKSPATIKASSPSSTTEETVKSAYDLHEYSRPFESDSEFRLSEFVMNNGLSASVTRDLIKLISDSSFDPIAATDRLTTKAKIAEVIRLAPEYAENVRLNIQLITGMVP